jgi:CO dehydrogenase maturation factor
VDAMLIVADSSMKSMEIAKGLYRLTKDLGIKKIFMVGNKLAKPEERKLIENFAKKNDIPLLGLVPFDEQVIEADMNGETPLQYAETSGSVVAIRKIGEELVKLS